MNKSVSEQFANAKLDVCLTAKLPDDPREVLPYLADDAYWCHLWTGTKNKAGYGIIKTKGKNRKSLRAHRVAWEFYYRPIPAGLLVLHHCDHPACVNPKHLHLGTQADNHLDRIAHGKRLSGENNGMSKLTAEQVRQIRKEYVPHGKGWRKGQCGRYQAVEGSIKLLADKFGMSAAQIGRIIRAERWK